MPGEGVLPKVECYTLSGPLCITMLKGWAFWLSRADRRRMVPVHGVSPRSRSGYDRRFLLDLNFRDSHANQWQATARDRGLTDRRTRHG